MASRSSQSGKARRPGQRTEKERRSPQEPVGAARSRPTGPAAPRQAAGRQTGRPRGRASSRDPRRRRPAGASRPASRHQPPRRHHRHLRPQPHARSAAGQAARPRGLAEPRCAGRGPGATRRRVGEAGGQARARHPPCHAGSTDSPRRQPRPPRRRGRRRSLPVRRARGHPQGAHAAGGPRRGAGPAQPGGHHPDGGSGRRRGGHPAAQGGRSHRRGGQGLGRRYGAHRHSPGAQPGRLPGRRQTGRLLGVRSGGGCHVGVHGPGLPLSHGLRDGVRGAGAGAQGGVAV